MADDKIAKALDLSPLVQFPKEISSEVSIIEAESINASVNDDFEEARNTITESIQKGKLALDDLIDLAQQAQSARAYEVVAKLIDSLTNSSEKLLELQLKLRGIQEIDNTGKNPAKTIHNNLFVGSTKELGDLLENIRKDGSQS